MKDSQQVPREKTRRILFIGAIVICLAAFSWVVLHSREPTFQGKSLTFWLEKLSQSNGPNIDQVEPEAAFAVRQIGAKAVPRLLSLAAAKDTRTYQFLRKLAEKQSYIHFPISSEEHFEHLNELAAYGFYALGTRGEKAAPDLGRLLKDDDAHVRGVAACSLGFMGEAARPIIPELISLLENSNRHPIEVDGVVYALNELGPLASSTIPMLQTLLTNSNSSVRPMAQAALIRMNAAPLSPFLEQLKDTSNMSNWNFASDVVVQLRTNAVPAVPLLILALENTNSQVQSGALYTLGMLHLRPELAVPAILPFIHSTNTITLDSAVDALRQFGKAAKPAVPALLECMSASNQGMRERISNALSVIDPGALENSRINDLDERQRHRAETK